jgi:acyl-CoA reductase-like NAD-dependent aldehyde dehydrogenase
MSERQPSGAPPATPRSDIDQALTVLSAGKDRWANLPLAEKLALLDRVQRDLAPLAELWSNAAADAKGLPRDSREAGEEWFTFAVMERNVRLLRRSLTDIGRYGRPRLPGRPHRATSGHLVVPVFPQTTADRLVFSGLRGEAWLKPGVDETVLEAEQAALYRDSRREGRLTLVLGAGNVTALGPSDILDKLFCEGHVVIYKAHPVTAYTGPLTERGFAALIEAGALRIVYGGAEEGTYLAYHPQVDELHITGSDRTYEAIVFGPGEEGARRKATQERILTKRFTCELGNVSPVIVVPGPWSDADLAYQGEQLAATLTINAGFFCLTTRVIVQHAGWPLRDALLDRVRRTLTAIPTRPAYYPGAERILTRFLSAHPAAERIGAAGEGHLPWTLIAGLDAEKRDEPCFTTEAFCPLFAETALAAGSVPDFIDRAAAFCNERLWGTLTATLLVHPRSLRDPAVAAAVDRAVSDLRYGTLGVNVWGLYGYVSMTGSWGAFPGHPSHDIQSGQGTVHNLLMLPCVEKTVLRAPFRIRPKPPTLPSHRNLLAVGHRLAEHEAAPSPWRLGRLMLAALRS